MENEINDLPAEYIPLYEHESPTECNKEPLGNEIPDSPSYDELNRGKKKKAKSTVSRIIVSAAILAIITTVMLPSVNSANITAEFVHLNSTDTTVTYEISISEFNSKDDISIVLYNDFTNRVLAVDNQISTGEIMGLKPNVEYTIAVKSGKKTIAKQTIRTKKS